MLIHNNSCPTSEYKTAIHDHNGKTQGHILKGDWKTLETKPRGVFVFARGALEQNLGRGQNLAIVSLVSKSLGEERAEHAEHVHVLVRLVDPQGTQDHAELHPQPLK